MKSISPGLKTQCSTVASLKRGNLSWSGESRLICENVIQDVTRRRTRKARRRTRRTRRTMRTKRITRTKRTRMFGHLTLNCLSLTAQWIGIEGGKGVSNQSYLKKVWILSMMQRPQFTPVFSLVS